MFVWKVVGCFLECLLLENIMLYFVVCYVDGFNNPQFIMSAFPDLNLKHYIYFLSRIHPVYELRFGVVVRMSILDTKVAGSNLSINMFSP